MGWLGNEPMDWLGNEPMGWLGNEPMDWLGNESMGWLRNEPMDWLGNEPMGWLRNESVGWLGNLEWGLTWWPHVFVYLWENVRRHRGQKSAYQAQLASTVFLICSFASLCCQEREYPHLALRYTLPYLALLLPVATVPCTLILYHGSSEHENAVYHLLAPVAL